MQALALNLLNRLRAYPDRDFHTFLEDSFFNFYSYKDAFLPFNNTLYAFGCRKQSLWVPPSRFIKVPSRN